MIGVPNETNSSDDNRELSPDNLQGAGVLDGVDAFEEKTPLDKIFEMMLHPDNIVHFTELNAQEITAFSTLGSLSEKYMPEGIIHGWLLKNLQMRVSKSRKGKGEAVKITSRLPQDQPPMNNGGFGGFFRR